MVVFIGLCGWSVFRRAIGEVCFGGSDPFTLFSISEGRFGVRKKKGKGGREGGGIYFMCQLRVVCVSVIEIKALPLSVE